MPHIGALKQALPFRFEIVGGASGYGAVTVYTIRRDRISEVETLSGVSPEADRTINQGVARIIFFVAPFPGVTLLFKVTQGTIMFEETCNADTHFVFDVV